MKIKKIIPIIVLLLMLVGCRKAQCTHDYNSNYIYNEEYHWQTCDLCDEQHNKSSHLDNDQDGICDVCNYNLIFKTNTLNNNECEIISYKGKEASIITIPSVVNDEKVTKIADNAFSSNSYIESVIISEGIKEIGNSVFENCSNLNAVVLPSSIKTIGADSFKNTSLLTVEYKGTESEFNEIIVLDETVSSEDVEVKTECEHTNLVVEHNENEHWYYCNDCEETYGYEGHTLVKEETSATCTMDGKIVYTCEVCGYSYTEVLKKTGHDYKYEVQKESTCTTAGIVKYTCSKCDDTYEDALPLAAHTTGDNWFNNSSYHWQTCSSCGKNVNLAMHKDNNNDRLCDTCGETVGDFLYEYSDNSCTIINYSGSSEIKALEIPSQLDGYTVIGISQGALIDCVNLEELIIPFVGGTKDDTSSSFIGYIFGADNYLYNSAYVPTTLKKVTINNIKNLPEYSFYQCLYLEEVVLPESLESISDNAFDKCSSLKTIVGSYFDENNELVELENNELSNVSLRIIGEYAFANCTSLSKITIAKCVEEIGAFAFYKCINLEEITVPFIGNSLTGLENTHFGYIFGSSVYSNNNSYIPTSLTKVNIYTSNSIDIGDYAFYKCENITSIEMDDSISSLGKLCFAYCTSLENIVLSKKVEELKEKTFYKCSSLRTLILPENLTKIGQYAFGQCSKLEMIVINTKLNNVLESAFVSTNSLTYICYKGSEDLWNQITIEESGNEYIQEEIIYLYSESNLEGNYWHYKDNIPSIWTLENTAEDEDLDVIE